MNQGRHCECMMRYHLHLRVVEKMHSHHRESHSPHHEGESEAVCFVSFPEHVLSDVKGAKPCLDLLISQSTVLRTNRQKEGKESDVDAGYLNGCLSQILCSCQSCLEYHQACHV